MSVMSACQVRTVYPWLYFYNEPIWDLLLLLTLLITINTNLTHIEKIPMQKL